MELRIQKYMSDCGIMSRRAAEKEINAGKITVNGVIATIGDKIDPKKDILLYDGKPILHVNTKYYILLNKPAGYVTTMSDELGRASVRDLLSDIPTRVYPVGRLDKNSEGALICTNDGNFANCVMHPKFELKKVYIVHIKGLVSNSAIDKLQTMKKLDDEVIAPVNVSIISRSPDSSTLRFVLSEGKNRQIRRMCESAVLTVMQLKRISIGKIPLADLPSGKWRNLTKTEINDITGK